MEKIKLGAVSYLNTKPLLYGIKQGEKLLNKIIITEDYPSRISAMLLDGSIDIGLVPVAILPKLKEYFIVSDYCIGACGDVASVCLFSDVPLHEIKTVLMDYQSETSVALCKILMKGYWNINPSIENTNNEFGERITGTTAAIMIGDRALMQRSISKYVYDLAGNWKSFTGLPFVFAAWVANKKIDPAFIFLFNECNKFGIENIDEVIKQENFPLYNLHTYYTKNISYLLDDEKKKGMDLFLKMMEK